MYLRTISNNQEGSFSLRSRREWVEGVSWLESGADDIYCPPTFLVGLSRGKEKMKLNILKGLESLRGRIDFWPLGIFGLMAF